MKCAKTCRWEKGQKFPRTFRKRLKSSLANAGVKIPKIDRTAKKSCINSIKCLFPTNGKPFLLMDRRVTFLPFPWTLLKKTTWNQGLQFYMPGVFPPLCQFRFRLLHPLLRNLFKLCLFLVNKSCPLSKIAIAAFQGQDLQLPVKKFRSK